MMRKHRNRERGRQLMPCVPVVTVTITIRGATHDQEFAEETEDQTNKSLTISTDLITGPLIRYQLLRYLALIVTITRPQPRHVRLAVWVSWE